ncbi:MAG: hypothetical protein ABH865_06515 [Candidatus Omnitrophota bacterium]
MSIIYDALNKVEKKEKELTPLSALADASMPKAARETASGSYAGTAGIAAVPRPRVSVKFILITILVGSLALYIVTRYATLPAHQVAIPKASNSGPFSAPAPRSTVDAAQTFVNMVRPIPSDATADAPAYILQGIIYDTKSPLALINGKKVSLGEAIADARVVMISSDGVELATGNTTIFLPLE